MYVWHEGLLSKPEQTGVTGNLLDLFRNYRYTREQRSALNYWLFSDWGPIEKGIKSSIKFFVDDTSIFSIVNDQNNPAEELNHDLQLFNQWGFQWKMSQTHPPLFVVVKLTHHFSSIIWMITGE